MTGARRARSSRAAALVVPLALALAGSITTAARAQGEAAPPSAVPPSSSERPPAGAETKKREKDEKEKPAPKAAPPAETAPEKKAEEKPAEPPAAKAPPAPVPPTAPAPKPPAPKPPAPAAPAPAAPAPNVQKAAVPAAKPSPAPPRPVAPPPTVSAPPRQTPRPAATTPPVEELPPELDPRTVQLERDIREAMRREPPDVARLEQVCAAWQPRKILEERPVLTALLPLCLARAAMLRENDDHAERKLDEALAALRSLPVDATTLEVRAEVLFRRAELREEALTSFERCGDTLGLRRLAAWEAAEASRRLEEAMAAYREVVRTGARRWARRALFRTGVLYDDFYRDVAGSLPTTYLGVPLPSPFLVEERDGAALLRGFIAPQAAAWPREIARLYDVVHDELTRAGDDPALLAEVDARRQAFRELKDLPRELAKNPWLDALEPGLLRRTQRGFEERTADGTWRVLDEADARRRLDAALAGGVQNVKSAWALVALAGAGIPVELSVLEQALASDDERVRVSALVALTESPRKELYEALVARWQALGVRDDEPLFTSLQAALFAEKERALLALRALADRERDLAGKLAEEPRLPLRVRAYLLAELGDTRLLPHYQRLAATPDRTATAVALYGMYLAAGRRMVWSLQPGAAEPVGCVSRNLKGLFEDEASKLD